MLKPLTIPLIILLVLFHTTLEKQTPPKYPYSSKELKCLADNVYYEARGEGFYGKILVAKTTINRSLDPRFPKSICAVVYQANQFSWTLVKQNKPVKHLWEESVLAVFAAQHSTSEALYFHAIHVTPYWIKSKTFLYTIGNHSFYK